ncbi:MAG: DUF6141 family protein [Bacteroidota bacterium]
MADFSTPGLFFEEKQKFKQSWLMWIVGAAMFISVIPLLLTLKGPELFVLIPYIIFSIFMLLFMRESGLKTQVRADGFYYRFFPFHFRTKSIPWDKVEDYEIVKYNPILDYGGWGIKYKPFQKDRAYNVSGNQGMKLYLKNGKKIMFGTQQPMDLQEAMLEIFKPDGTDNTEDDQAIELKDHYEVVKKKIKLKDDEINH